jgi:hypothetical protein
VKGIPSLASREIAPGTLALAAKILLPELPERTMIHAHTHIPQYEEMGRASSTSSPQPLVFTPAGNLSMILFDH